MNNLVLNISEVKKENENVKLNIEDYLESLETYITGILKVDGCWNDKNTDVFIKLVNEEKDKFNEHAQSLLDYVDFIDDFCDDLQTSLNIKLDGSLLTKVQYYSSLVDSSFEFLDYASSFLDEAIIDHANLQVPSSCNSSSDIRNLFSNIKSNEISDTKSDVNDCKEKLVKVINEYKEKSNEKKFLEIDENICELHYKTVN